LAAAFFETEFGKATDRLLMPREGIREALERAFSAHKSFRAKEKKCILTRQRRLLEPGDKLVAYAGETQLKGPDTSAAERARI